MAKYRQTLTFETIGGIRGVILQCNKSEKKSVVRHYLEDGAVKWMPDKITSQHTDGTPKHLHIAIAAEGIYEVFGQPTLSGLYCFYKNLRGIMYYAPISMTDKKAIQTARTAGQSYRDALIALKKSVF